MKLKLKIQMNIAGEELGAVVAVQAKVVAPAVAAVVVEVVAGYENSWSAYRHFVVWNEKRPADEPALRRQSSAVSVEVEVVGGNHRISDVSVGSPSLHSALRGTAHYRHVSDGIESNCPESDLH